MNADAGARRRGAFRRGDEANCYLACFPAKPLPLVLGRAYSIGRAEGNNIILADADVSRNHAIITGDGQEFVLKDLGSRNGTFVNRRRVQGPCVLQADDRIKIGNRMFTFLVETERDIRQLYDQKKADAEEDETEILQLDALTAPEQGFAGSLADFGMSELIQTLELNRKTGVLTVVGDHGRGTVTVRDGRPIGAELGESSGEEAVYALLQLVHGFFEFEVRDSVEVADPIEIQTRALLMESSRRQDEQRRSASSFQAPSGEAVVPKE